MKIATLLVLPCVLLLAVGAGVARFQAQEKQKIRAYYSQPFEPELRLQRGKVPGYASPGLFEVEARCIGKGGAAHSRWLVRAVMVTNQEKTAREIWNSQKLVVPNIVSPVMSGNSTLLSGGQAASASGRKIPTVEASYSWRFLRSQGVHNNFKPEATNLTMIVEAVAMSVPVPEEEFGGMGISVAQATPAQLAVARQQPGAKYLRQSIELKAQDDSQFQFSRAQ